MAEQGNSGTYTLTINEDQRAIIEEALACLYPGKLGSRERIIERAALLEQVRTLKVAP